MDIGKNPIPNLQIFPRRSITPPPLTTHHTSTPKPTSNSPGSHPITPEMHSQALTQLDIFQQWFENNTIPPSKKRGIRSPAPHPLDHQQTRLPRHLPRETSLGGLCMVLLYPRALCQSPRSYPSAWPDGVFVESDGARGVASAEYWGCWCKGE